MPAIEFPNGPSGGDTMLVKSGGLIEVQAGGKLTVGGTEITEETLAMTGLTASAAELNKLAGSGAVVPSGTAAAHQGDLATDANGTAIAAAVNGLRDVLVAFGLMAGA